LDTQDLLNMILKLNYGIAILYQLNGYRNYLL